MGNFPFGTAAFLAPPASMKRLRLKVSFKSNAIFGLSMAAQQNQGKMQMRFPRRMREGIAREAASNNCRKIVVREFWD
jgi:hypothetical protein